MRKQTHEEQTERIAALEAWTVRQLQHEFAWGQQCFQEGRQKRSADGERIGQAWDEDSLNERLIVRVLADRVDKELYEPHGWEWTPQAGALLRAFIRVFYAGFREYDHGQQFAGSQGGAAKGKIKGPFALFVLELVRLKVALEVEAIQAFFATAEEGLALPDRELTKAHRKALGLLIKANAKARKPLATDDHTLGLDETGPKPVIRYRLEGNSKLRTCTDHNLRTRVIPAVQEALAHK